MPMSRPLAVTIATVSATLVALPTYASVSGPDRAGVPAATPTRITPSGTPSAGSSGPGGDNGAPSGGAGSSGSKTQSTRTTYKAPKPSGAVDAPKVPTITPSSRFDVEASPKPGQAPDKSWPDAKSVFTEGELAEVIPGLQSVQARTCRPSQVGSGRESAHNTRCVLDLTIKGEPRAVSSKLVVNIRGFGSPDSIGRAWSSSLADQQERSSDSNGRYTFYRNGQLGASGAYSDGTTAKVLVQRPGVAGEIWFSGIGFTQLKSDYLSSRKDFRERVTPALIKLLAAKMKPA